jgi:methionyl-tRNA formyltransferase
MLPDYRGAAPINWAIIKGERETGVTTFFIQHDIDTGNVILQEREPIFEDDTAGSLYGRLMDKGAGLVLKTVEAIRDGNYTTSVQKEPAEDKKAPKIFREDCEIDWNQSSKQVYDFVRGLSPYPGAYAQLNGKMYKIFRVSMETGKENLEPGAVNSNGKTAVWVGTADGSVSIEELQPEGKKKMDIEAFLRGNRI